jgi:hypothetical protein
MLISGDTYMLLMAIGHTQTYKAVQDVQVSIRYKHRNSSWYNGYHEV